MERQQEYELRKKIADAIQNDVDRVFSEKLQLFNHDFYYEILFPLIVLEMNYKMKSEESLAAGLGDSNEYLILVNPLREAIYWYIHRVLISDRKISFSKKRYVPSLGEEYSFVEYVLQLHDEFKRGEQIREIRDCASKVMIKPEDDNTYGFYFPVISEKYHKELLYYYGLDDTLNFEVEKEIFVECEKYLHDKINVKELIKHPQKIYIFYNILNRMANVIDTKYFELCKKRVMSDLNKISSSSLRSLDDNTNKVIIGSKDELATFLALLYYLSIGIDPNRALCINCNLNGSCTELLSIHADIVVMDPPWYLNYYQLFFDRAAIMSALDTQIMCIMPPKFTRAKTESETYSLLEMIKKDYGFVKKHYFTGVVTYHTPPYEQNVLKTNGIYCNPENWRIGDLLIVEKVYNVITTCTHDVSIIEPEWDEACVNNIRIKYRTCESKIDNYNIELERIFNDDIYPSVKRSFGGKKTINVWTSGNRVFWCNNMAVLKMILRNIDRDIFEVIVENGYRIPNKEELEQLEKIQGKLLDVIRLEAEEYGSSWRIAI